MNNKRFRNFEFILYPDNQEDIDFLYLIKKSGVKYAYILHNMDIKEDGELKEKHIHLLVFNDDACTITAFCDRYGYTKYNKCEIVKAKKQAIRYLIHIDYEEKYQYDVQQIITNFDISPYFNNLISDETIQVAFIFDYIESCKGFISTKALYQFVIKENCWSTFRRNYSLIRDLVAEHNMLVSEVKIKRLT